MRTKNTGRMALSAVLTALAVVVLLLTATPIATIGLAALAGVCGIPIVVEWGRKAGLIHFVAVAVLALLAKPMFDGISFLLGACRRGCRRRNKKQNR